MCVRAHFHRTAGLALVAERVHVADDRETDLVARGFELGNRSDVDHLVHRGCERDRRAGHGRDPRAPHPARDHHVLRRDPAPVGDDRLHAPVRDLDRQHLDTRDRLQRTEAHCPLAKDRSGTQRVDHRDARCVETAEHDVGIDEGQQLADLGGRQQLGLDAPCRRRGHTATELLEALRLARDLDATTADVDPHRLVLPLAVERERRHLAVVIDGKDEVRRVSR